MHVQYPCWRCMALQDKINCHTPAMFPGETSYNAALKWFHQSSCDLICKAFSFSFRKMEQPICISKAFQIHVPSLTQGLIRPQAQWASFPTWTNSYKLGLIASNYCSDFCARDACLIAIVALFLICQTRGSTQILHFTKAMPQCKNTALQGKVLHFIREVRKIYSMYVAYDEFCQ